MYGNAKFIFSFDQDISRVRKENEWDINTRNKFHISKYPCVVLCISKYKKVGELPIRIVKSNVSSVG